MSLSSEQKIKLFISCLVFFVCVIFVINFVVKKSEQEVNKEIVVSQPVAPQKNVVEEKQVQMELTNQEMEEKEATFSEGPLLQ